jgi:ribosomal protein L14E/L6E/L27E
LYFQKNGRDKSSVFVVLRCEGEYVYLVDGVRRTLVKPKKKKIKHVQITHQVIDLTATGGRALQDADIRKWLQLFQEGR